MPVNVEGRAGKGRRAQGAAIGPVVDRRDAGKVPLEGRGDIGEIIAERDRLRRLEMGIARHDHVDMAQSGIQPRRDRIMHALEQR